MSLPIVQGKILYNVDLKKYNWFGVGGKADIVYFPKDINDLQYFLKNKDKDLNITLVGSGSNILIRDGGIKGVVIILKDTFKHMEYKNKTIEAECGALNLNLFQFAKQHKVANFEFLGTIPGTIGGAIRGNAGCYNQEIKDILISIEAIDFNGNIKTFSKEECNFEYRKNNISNDLIFTKAIFNANTTDEENNIQDRFDEMINKRNLTQPHGVKTCGSTFKNPNEKTAWKIIQELGFQGKETNGMMFSDKHANFLINTGNAKGNDIENYGNKIRNLAKKKLNINLEWEIKIIGKKYNHSFMVSRFQPFHNGHKTIIDKMLEDSKNITIILGSTQESRTIKNPFTYEERVQMIKNVYGNINNIKIIPSIDLGGTIEDWYKYIMELLENNAKEFGRPEAYYGGSMDDNYWYDLGELEINTIERKQQIGVNNISATQIREMIKNNDENWKNFVHPNNIDYIIKLCNKLSIFN